MKKVVEYIKFLRTAAVGDKGVTRGDINDALDEIELWVNNMDADLSDVNKIKSEFDMIMGVAVEASNNGRRKAVEEIAELLEAEKAVLYAGCAKITTSGGFKRKFFQLLGIENE